MRFQWALRKNKNWALVTLCVWRSAESLLVNNFVEQDRIAIAKSFMWSLLCLAIAILCLPTQAQAEPGDEVCFPLYREAGAVPGQASCSIVAPGFASSLGTYFCRSNSGGYIQRYCGQIPKTDTCNLRGNPIDSSNGNKFANETDIQNAALPLRRYYNSDLSKAGGSAFGIYWRSNYDRRVIAVSTTTTAVYRPDGSILYFTLSSGKWTSSSDVKDQLNELIGSDAVRQGWTVRVASDNSLETFDADGKLIGIDQLGEKHWRLGYSNSLTPSSVAPKAGLLVLVSDQFGHALNFSYDASARVSSVTDTSGKVYLYSYDGSSHLLKVTYPDLVQRTYVYNEPAFTGGESYPNALTGIVDEGNDRFATFTYDAITGRAVSSEHAGGTSRYAFTYSVDANGNRVTTETDPLNTTRALSFKKVLGVDRLGGSTQPDASGSGICLDSRAYDINGNVTSRTDFNGNITTYQYDLSRNLEIRRTEASGTSQARTITTQWHVSYRLPLIISTYNGDNVTGTPIETTAYTYDASGNQLTKTIIDPAANILRIWSYSYNQYGQVLTADGPRTDVSDVTTYTYYDCTTGAECGQVHTVTNALGQVTTFATYNTAGQPLSVIDANGVTTTLTYDARQRLLTRSIAGETTSFAYWPTGLLKQVTLPDASTMTYNYDAAHRLTSVVDSEGNSLVYTLDAAGNRTQEKALDATGNVVRSHSRVFDNLSRLAQELGAASQSTSYAYDNNGNLLSVTDPASHTTTYQYDALNRLASLIDPALHTTGYGYDAQDNLTQVTDPNNLTTSYTYNGLGDLTQLTSPDTGITQYARDTAGNLDLATDARTKSGDYSYDALGRVTQIQYSDQTQTFTYDQGTNAQGRLTQVTDSSGNTQWTYSPQGRVLSKQQTIGTHTFTVNYGYNAAGQLTTLTTPSGQVINLGYANSKITTLSVNSLSVLNQVLYSPFGPTQGWTWGNGTLTVREYDQDGQLTTIDSAGLSTYTYNADGTIATKSEDSSANLSLPTGTTNLTISTTSNRIATTTGTLARTYSYDAAGNTQSDGNKSFTYNDASRLISATNLGITTTYQYNALGQRVSKSNSEGTTYFVYDEAGHLLGEYDATGNLIQELVWLGDIPVATIRTDQGGSGVGVFYIHTDNLNAPTKVTRPSDNAVIWRWDHDPYGNGIPNQDPDGNGLQLTMNIRFAGQYYDAETGLYQNYFRDCYDPQTGRYCQPDPIGLAGGLNPFAYVGGNPISYVDPEGLLGHSPGPSNRAPPPPPPPVGPEAKDYICKLLASNNFNVQLASVVSYNMREEDNGANDNPVWRQGENWLTAAAWNRWYDPQAYVVNIYLWQYTKFLPWVKESYSQAALNAGLDGHKHANQSKDDLKKWCNACGQ